MLLPLPPSLIFISMGIVDPSTICNDYKKTGTFQALLFSHVQHPRLLPLAGNADGGCQENAATRSARPIKTIGFTWG
jgi:hypothetical protein